MATSLELAITAIRSGRKEEGRQLLNLLIQQNPNNELAWLWMSSVVNTDEQRARCLYHVLAINPDNELARRGLQILGIVVSDSRPVKVPRDSQPIPVQRPEAEAVTPWPISAAPKASDTQPLPEAPAPALSKTMPMAERRPFRLDPKTITQELPFVPIREPFAEPARRSPSAFAPREENNAAAPPEAPLPNGAAISSAQPALTVDPNQGTALIPLPKNDLPLPDFPDPQAASSPIVGFAAPPATDTGPLPAQPPSGIPAAVPPQPPFVTGAPINETRPSQPIWVTHSNVTMGMPTPPNQLPYPAPNLNSNVTMGMPTHYLQPQNPMQAMPLHANATMGMSMPPQNGQISQGPEAMQNFQPNGGMNLAGYPPAPFQQPYPQNQIYHSSATMAMPTMTEAEARARLMTGQPMPMPLPVDPYAALRLGLNPSAPARSSKKSSKKGAKEDEEGEEVNLLAVIVFGSLSVTALGGMGMLILLWFTSV